MNSRNEILMAIEEKERQLHRAERESEAWSRGKGNRSLNAEMSKKYVESLRREIKSLHQKLESVTE